MTPRPANRHNRAVTMDPKSLTLAQLNAPPRNSLILLALARNLVTTGTRSHLAQRIFEHEHANSPAHQAIAPNLPASTENPGVSEDLERPSRSTGRQQPSSTPGSQFSPDQLSQLRELITETVSSQRSGPGEASGLLADVPLLSPASPLNIAATTATEQNLNGVNLPNVIQDGGLSLRQLVPSLPQTSQGPAQQIVTNQAYEHDFTLPPLPEKLRSKISKREYIDFNELLSDNMYPHPSFASSQNNFTLTVDPQDATTLALYLPSTRNAASMAFLLGSKPGMSSCAPPYQSTHLSPQTSSRTMPRFATLAGSLKRQPGLCTTQPFAIWLPHMSLCHGVK